MSSDEELAKIFDVGDHDDGTVSDSMEDQYPSSSKCAEQIFVGGAGEGGVLKRKPGEAAGAVGSKRVRIATPPPHEETEVVSNLVAMGYDQAKVMFLWMSLGKPSDLNQVLDALMQQEETGASFGMQQESRAQMTSPCPFGGDPIEVNAENLMESLDNISSEQLIRPSPQKPSPSFVDLCDESTLRKYLICKYPPTEDSREFVMRTAAMMAQRLSQVTYVSTVARLAEHIFSICDLYKHFLARLPSEPASGIIDREGIVRENDAPFGVQIDVAETFINNGGLDRIAERIRDPAMTIKEIGCLCGILHELSSWTFPRALDDLMREAAEKMRSTMGEYSDKEIRDEKTRREIFEASRKVCKGMTPGASSSTSPRYEFIERLMLCGNMDAKKNAIDELAYTCDHESEATTSVRRWMKKQNILTILLADHLDHPEYVSKIGPILRKLAPVLSEREFRLVWCLQKGRGGISQDTFSHLLANLAAGFQDDQIVMLFKYFKKQLKQTSGGPVPKSNLFLRMTDIVLHALTRANFRPAMETKDRLLFIESYMRLLDRFLSTNPSIGGWSIMTMTFNYTAKISDMFRGLQAGTIGYALSKIAKEVNRMKEMDRRFPFYFTLIHNIASSIKSDLPGEYKLLGPLLLHHKFAEKGTRMLIAMARMTHGELERLDVLARASDEMQKQRAALQLQQQQDGQEEEAAGDAAAAAAPAAASAASSLQPSPVPAASAAAAAAAADAPPPSAITPISNGPSPKRDGSPAGGTSARDSPEATSSSSESTDAASAAPAASAAQGVKQEEVVKENGVGRKEETASSSVCTPPGTPEPLRVSTARVGSEEWEKELVDLQNRVQLIATDASIRTVQYTQLVMVWQDAVMADEPIPGCELVALPSRVIEEVFSVLVDATKGGHHKRIVQMQAGPFWAMQPHMNNMFTVIRTMLKTFEHAPVFRAFVSKLCTMPADLVSIAYVDVVRSVTDTCCKSARFEGSTDWLEEILRFMWRLAVCRMSDVREKAVDVLKLILCERFRTLKLVTVFGVARLNEALDNFNRFSGRAPIPHWEVRVEEDEEELEEDVKEDGKMEEDQEEEIEVEKKEEEEEMEEGEQAVDLSLAREKKARASAALSKEAMRKMLEGMRMQAEVKTREEAEFQLSRTISFLRRIVTYGYLETKHDDSLIIRDRAIPGEVCDLLLRVYGPVASSNVQISFPANEPLCAFAERVRKVLPHSPPVFHAYWPKGFKVRHFSNTINWEKPWTSVGEQLGLNTRGGAEDCQIMLNGSPFNIDFGTEASIRREQGSEKSKPVMQEKSLGHLINESNLVPLLHALISGVTSGHLQDSVLHLVQQLPLQAVREDALGEICGGALQLHRPHQALHHLITLLTLLLPPTLTSEMCARAKVVLNYLRQTGFVTKFMGMIREIDRISECLSVEWLVLFHEVCLTFIRLFYLRDSGKHRAYVKNVKRREKRGFICMEESPLDTHVIGAGLSNDEVPALLRTMFQFAWATAAPRRIDVERDLQMIVPAPSVRIELAKEKKVEHHMSHRRTQVARCALGTMLAIADTYGSKDKNINALFNPDLIDGITVTFWRDMLMYCGPKEIQNEACMLLCSLIETEDQRIRIQQELGTPMGPHNQPIARKLLLRLVFVLGRNILWGPTAAMEYAATGRSPVNLLTLAEKVVRTSKRDEIDEALLDEWLDLQTGFMSSDRPPWNARCHVAMHVGLLQELIKKMEDYDKMAKLVRGCLPALLAQALFPFAVGYAQMEERCGMLPAKEPIGCGLAEGEVRKKYLDIIIYYAERNPEMIMPLLEYLAQMVHHRPALHHWPIGWWEKGEKFRRQRTESFCGAQLSLAQRLHHLSAVRETDVRLVKGLSNPSYMCYANSVLQQLIFMPGVCEGLFALGDLTVDLAGSSEAECRDGLLLRATQFLFANMLFGADQVPSAEFLLMNIDLPSGGSVREQQDCVEFFLTLIDKCDTTAEKFNRPPVFKRFLEGSMGYEYACKTCKHRHRGVDESFTALNLEIHGATVVDSLDHFMDGALLEGASAAMCEQCGEKRTTLRIGALRSAPTTLCIQLKRFSTFDSNGGKLNSKVDVPPELDLTRYSEAVRTATDEQVEKMFGWFDDTQDEPVVFTPPPDCPVRWRYRLVGVIVHSGQLGNGHYTSYVKERRSFMRGRPWFDHWLLANDDRVTMQEDKLIGEWQGSGEENAPSAYLLWYEMIADDEAAMIRQDTVSIDRATVPRNGTVTPEDEYEDNVVVPEEDLLIPEEYLAMGAIVDEDMRENGKMEEGEEEEVAENGTVTPKDHEEVEEEMKENGRMEEDEEEEMEEENKENGKMEEEEEEIEEEEEEEELSSATRRDTVVFLREHEEAMRRIEEMLKMKQECEWMDIGLGSLGVLEGARLDLYKCLPINIRQCLLKENIVFQLSRDVLTESYARFLLKLLLFSREHYLYRPVAEKQPAFRKLAVITRIFTTEVLWRTREHQSGEAEKVLGDYRLLLSNFLKDVDACTEWLINFYDPALQAVSEDWRSFLQDPYTMRAAIGMWFWLASTAILPLASRDMQMGMVEAFIAHMVECLRLPMFRLDGFCFFFIQTIINPHCIDYHIKHNILPHLVNVMFYYQKNNMTWGLQGEFTQRKNLPICTHLVLLYKRAIETEMVSEEEFKEFVETKLHLVMGPMVRHGDDYMIKMMELMIVAIRFFGAEDEAWVGMMAQSILTCLKVDPHRAGGLFYLVTIIGKNLTPHQAQDFYDEILGKREQEAAENGLIVPGVVIMLENMLAERKESRLIAQIENALNNTMAKVEGLRECAEGYTDRINGIKIRQEEWKEQEAEENAVSSISATRSMLMGAEAMAMLPMEACGPINRPPGCSMAGRDYDMMNVSDDEMDDEDEEDILSDEEGYSEDEGPVDLAPKHRR